MATFVGTPSKWAKVSLVKDVPAFGGGKKLTFDVFDGDFTDPLIYSIKSGELPPGMELDTVTGEVSGTPTSGGKFESTIQVSDSADPPAFAQDATSQPQVVSTTDPATGITTTTTTDTYIQNALHLVVAPGPELKDIKFVGPGGEPEWVSASLAEVPMIMELANMARQGATLLQKNLEATKAAAELTKTFLLLQASILSTILNAIADELEKLYNDLSKAGFYTLWLDGQENMPQPGPGHKVKVSATKAEMETRYARAKSASFYNKNLAKAAGLYTPADARRGGIPEQFPGNFAADFLEWLGKQYQSDGKTPLYAGITPDKLPSTIKIEINTDSWANVGSVKGGSILKAAIGGVETNFIQQQSPNQFLAKLMMKLDDESDPNTPSFSSQGQTGAIIMMVGIPDLSGLSDIAKIMDQIGNFVGAAITGAWQIIKDLLKAAGIYDVDKPKGTPDPEFKMTLYGVRGLKPILSPAKLPMLRSSTAKGIETENIPKVFEVGDYLVGEDSGMSFVVTATKKDPDYVDYYSGQKTRKDLGYKQPTVLAEKAKKKNKEGKLLCVDQTLMLRPTALGTSVEWFGQMWPGETVRQAYYSEAKLPTYDKDNATAIFGELQNYYPIDPTNPKTAQQGDYVDKKAVDEGTSNKGKEEKAVKQVRTDKTKPKGPVTNSFFRTWESLGVTDLSGGTMTEFSETVFADKNLPAKPANIIPPAWGHATLVDAFEAYGEFLKYILIFAQFLRDLSSGVAEQIDKIIAFIDEMIAIAEEIVASILALLAFFEAIKDAGMYMLIIQDPDGSGLLQGGTDALIDAIGSATGQDATPQVDDDLNIIENPDLDLRRIKPPETLRYTFGFALVFGGPGAQEGFANIAKLVKGEDEG